MATVVELTRGRVALALTAAALTVALLGGCSSARSTPEGFERVAGGWLVVDVPTDLQDTGPGPQWWTRSWADDTDPAVATVQLLAAPTFGFWGSTLQAEGILLVGPQTGGLPGYQVTGVSDVVEDDELEVRRVDFTYEVDGEALAGVAWAAAHPPSKKTVAVQLTAVELDEAMVSAVQDSIRVVDTDATMDWKD